MSGSHEKLPMIFWVQIVLVLIVGLIYLTAETPKSHAGETAKHEVDAATKTALKPVGEVAVKAEAGAGGGAARSGEEIVKTKCAACHIAGVANAPKLDPSAKDAWAKRLEAEKGLDGLVASAQKGKGGMPPNGADPSLTADDLKVAIINMLETAGVEVAAADKAPAPAAKTAEADAAKPADSKAAAAPAAPAAATEAAANATDTKAAATPAPATAAAPAPAASAPVASNEPVSPPTEPEVPATPAKAEAPAAPAAPQAAVAPTAPKAEAAMAAAPVPATTEAAPTPAANETANTSAPAPTAPAAVAAPAAKPVEAGKPVEQPAVVPEASKPAAPAAPATPQPEASKPVEPATAAPAAAPAPAAAQPEASKPVEPAAAAPAPAAPAPAAAKAEVKPDLAGGEKTYKTICFSCHDMNVANAPKPGDKAAWAPRIAKGMDVLYNTAVKGDPKMPTMPAKGGNPNLSDAEVINAVYYMVEASK